MPDDNFVPRFEVDHEWVHLIIMDRSTTKPAVVIHLTFDEVKKLMKSAPIYLRPLDNAVVDQIISEREQLRKQLNTQTEALSSLAVKMHEALGSFSNANRDKITAGDLAFVPAVVERMRKSLEAWQWCRG